MSDTVRLARRDIAQARRTLRNSYGALAVMISLPRPWGAAVVHRDGRVTTPSGDPIPEFAR